MPWYILMYLLSTLIDWIRIGRLSDQEKDLEILLLHQQLGIAERKLHKSVRVSPVERMTIAVLTTKLRSSGNRAVAQLRKVIRIFQPETVIGWHPWWLIKLSTGIPVRQRGDNHGASPQVLAS